MAASVFLMKKKTVFIKKGILKRVSIFCFKRAYFGLFLKNGVRYLEFFYLFTYLFTTLGTVKSIKVTILLTNKYDGKC